jgi:hypothetical protein
MAGVFNRVSIKSGLILSANKFVGVISDPVY